MERDEEAKNERGALIAQERAAKGDLAGVIDTGACIAVEGTPADLTRNERVIAAYLG